MEDIKVVNISVTTVTDAAAMRQVDGAKLPPLKDKTVLTLRLVAGRVPPSAVRSGLSYWAGRARGSSAAERDGEHKRTTLQYSPLALCRRPFSLSLAGCGDARCEGHHD